MTARPVVPRQAALLADIGGTHARFALRLADGTLTSAVDFPSHGFRDLEAAAREGLSLQWKSLPFEVAVQEAAVAVAGPVVGDRVELTNVSWSFSIEATRRELGLDRLLVINDLAAQAWAIPVLEATGGKAFIEAKDESERVESEALAEGRAKGKESSATKGRAGAEVSAVIAVGTGLGMATLARRGAGAGEVVLASEGGHSDLAATTEREWRVVERLRARFGEHVSIERAVSGNGLANLWTALAELDGERAGVSGIEPAEVTRRAGSGEARAVEALSLFSGWLGAAAGDLVLTVGARSGIWIGGGVMGALGAPGGVFDREAFRRRYLGKGRFEEWIRAVPVRAIDDPVAAFHGLARALASSRGT